MTDITIPKCITEELAEITRKSEKVKAMIPLARFGETLIEQFKDTPGLTAWRLNADDFMGITVGVCALDLLSLIPVRTHIRQNGFNAPHIHEFPNQRQRDWVYRKDGLLGTLRLSFIASLKDGAICKFVKVGTEQKDVYELQCNGEKVLQEA